MLLDAGDTKSITICPAGDQQVIIWNLKLISIILILDAGSRGGQRTENRFTLNGFGLEIDTRTVGFNHLDVLGMISNGFDNTAVLKGAHRR